MNADLHKRVSVLFLKAEKLPPDEQQAFLEKECAGQPELRAEVESLLQHKGAGAEMFSGQSVTGDLPPEAGELRPSDGREKTPARPGLVLSHYHLVEKIGEGGMGVVWKAQDTILNRQVAIKVLPDQVFDDGRRREQFLEEARLASQVSDAHIVQVHDFGHEQGLDFLVMEYVDGKPLSDILQGRPLPPHRVARYGHQVAKALSRAHHRNLLHRDLKPSNILITADDDVKVVDFGLATLFRPLGSTVTTESLKTVSGERTSWLIAGTLPYMSPEQARGERLDARSDIFSLGTVLYEMTTGRRPFLGETPEEIRQQITQGQPPPPHTLVREIPMNLEWILGKLLALRRGDRYQTMKDLAVDLKRLAQDLDSGAALWFGKVDPPPKPWLWLWTGLAAIGLVLATVITTYLIIPPEVQTQDELADVNPTARVWYRRGLEYYHLVDEAPGNIDYAIRMFHRAVGDDETFALAWAKLGEACWLHYEESREAPWRERAVDAVQTALRLEPELPEAHIARAYGLFIERKLSAARDELEAVVETSPELARAWVILGQTCQELGDYAAGLQAFEQAIALEPDEYRNHLWLGYFFKAFSELDAAAGAFEKARELKPDNPKPWNSLAGVLLPLRRFEEARDLLLHSIEIEDSAITRDLLATAQYYLEDYESAAENYRHATVLSPDKATHWANLGDALIVLERDEEARAAYGEAANLAQKEATRKPLDPEAHKKLGLYCSRAGDHECAIREIKLAEALKPDDPEVLFRGAIIFCLAGQIGEALDRLERAVHLGLSRAEIEADPDIACLGDNSRYQKIIQLAS